MRTFDFGADAVGWKFDFAVAMIAGAGDEFFNWHKVVYAFGQSSQPGNLAVDWRESRVSLDSTAFSAMNSRAAAFASCIRSPLPSKDDLMLT